ncbi:MAG: ABC transporter permease [Candidatus Riflebacteria bacterium]|nr:ABC transporter permease [Candidatus Riflebacteria bacterium]
MTTARMAWRNLWRSRRRTQLTMLAMVVATSLLIFVLTMNEGLLWDLVSNATEVIHGHLTIAAPGYIDNPAIEATLPETLPDLDGSLIRGSCSRVLCFALLSCGPAQCSQTHPAEILGVDPIEERRVSRLANSISTGTFLASTTTSDIILGKGLAQRLEAVPGSEIVFMSQSVDGGMAADLFRVSGIIETGDTARDAGLALVGRVTLQKLLGLEGRVHKHLLFLDSPLMAKEVAQQLAVRYSGMSFHPWQEQLPQIAQIFKIWGGVQVFMTAIFYFAVVLIALSTMFMAYRERMREFAILGAIGLTKRRLAALIITEGVWLGALSAVLGGIGGLGLSFYFHANPVSLKMFLSDISYAGASIQPRIYCVSTTGSVLMPVLAMLLLGPIVSIFPAWKLYRQRPVEALRED